PWRRAAVAPGPRRPEPGAPATRATCGAGWGARGARTTSRGAERGAVPGRRLRLDRRAWTVVTRNARAPAAAAGRTIAAGPGSGRPRRGGERARPAGRTPARDRPRRGRAPRLPRTRRRRPAPRRRERRLRRGTGS